MKRVSKCEKSISTGKFSTFTELINLTYGNLKKLLSFRSSHPEVFLEKVVPKVCRKFTGKHPYRSMIFRRRCSENMPQIYKRTPMPKCDFNKVALHGCSSVNLLHIFGTPFAKSTSARLLLKLYLPFSSQSTGATIRLCQIIISRSCKRMIAQLF